MWASEGRPALSPEPAADMWHQGELLPAPPGIPGLLKEKRAEGQTVLFPFLAHRPPEVQLTKREARRERERLREQERQSEKEETDRGKRSDNCFFPHFCLICCHKWRRMSKKQKKNKIKARLLLKGQALKEWAFAPHCFCWTLLVAQRKWPIKIMVRNLQRGYAEICWTPQFVIICLNLDLFQTCHRVNDNNDKPLTSVHLQFIHLA